MFESRSGGCAPGSTPMDALTAAVAYNTAERIRLRILIGPVACKGGEQGQEQESVQPYDGYPAVLRIIEVDDQEARSPQRFPTPSAPRAGLQARHVRAVESPPDDRMRMRAMSTESRFLRTDSRIRAFRNPSSRAPSSCSPAYFRRSLYRSLYPFFSWFATACAAFFAASGSPR